MDSYAEATIAHPADESIDSSTVGLSVKKKLNNSKWS
jgi:hypothetical protein